MRMSKLPVRLVAVIPTVEGRVVRSYAYTHFRPSISLSIALKTVDRWRVDEIAVIDISRTGELSSKVLDEIEAADSRTPILYGGGLRSPSDLRRLLNVGADRFLFEFGAFAEGSLLADAAKLVGTQAVVVSLPVTKIRGEYVTFPTGNPGKLKKLGLFAEELIQSSAAAEILIIDRESEGSLDAFDPGIARELSHLADQSVLWFGGLGPKSIPTLVGNPITAGVGLGNPLFQDELTVEAFRG